MDRADELRRNIRHVHSGKSNAVNKPIFVQKVYTVNVGIKCMETIQKIGMKKYILKNNASFSVDLPKETEYSELQTLLDPIITSSENLKPILVHIEEKLSNNTWIWNKLWYQRKLGKYQCKFIYSILSRTTSSNARKCYFMQMLVMKMIELIP